MKTINKIIGTLCLMLLIPLLNSCDNAKNKPLEDALYISESGTAASSLTIDDNKGANGSITVKSASPATNDIRVKIGASQEALDTYNTKHGTNFELLPDNMYTLSSTEVTIKTGAITSEKVDIFFKPFTKEMKDSGIKYALPITIISSSEPGILILDGKKTAVYACDLVIVTKALKLGRYDYVRPTMRNSYDLNNWSLEMRIKASNIEKAWNNQAFVQVASGTGSEADGFIYGRFEGDFLQFKVNGHDGFNGNNFVPKSKTWYHFALVCENGTLYMYIDGTLNNTLADVKFQTKAHFDKDSFTFALVSQWRKADITLHEVRFWTKAITATQIKSNMFAVDASTDGLEAYWKMNEGEGDVLNDATGHGNNAKILTDGGASNVEWFEVRSDDPATEE